MIPPEIPPSASLPAAPVIIDLFLDPEAPSFEDPVQGKKKKGAKPPAKPKPKQDKNSRASSPEDPFPSLTLAVQNFLETAEGMVEADSTATQVNAENQEIPLFPSEFLQLISRELELAKARVKRISRVAIRKPPPLKYLFKSCDSEKMILEIIAISGYFSKKKIFL